MNYYQILGVSENASQSEIREAYKKLIKQYHPDIYKGTPEYGEKVTQELNDAYDVLSNSEKKKEYDEILHPTQPQTTYTYTYTSYKEPPKEEPKPSFTDKMKTKIYKVVDEKTSNLSTDAKSLLVLVIIILGLLILALSIYDYIYYINSVEKSRNEDLQKNMIIENILEY